MRKPRSEIDNPLAEREETTISSTFYLKQNLRDYPDGLQEYVRIRFPYVYADDKRSYSRTIRAELARIFNVELSAETLRPLFAQLRARQEGAADLEKDTELSETQACAPVEAETSEAQSDDE